MPHFKLEKELPPLSVSKDLIESLRTYLLNTALSLKADTDSSEEIAKHVKISIKDRVGTETINSLSEFPQSKFSDSTEEIRVTLFRPYGTSLRDIEIQIRISKSRLFSSFDISCERKNAKEIATGISQGISSCLEPHISTAKWLHPPLPVTAGLWMATGVAFAIMLSTFNDAESITKFAAILSFSLLSLYNSLLPSLRPYSEFESKLTETRLKWWDWFMKGLLTFIVFGFAFTAIKDWAIGV